MKMCQEHWAACRQAVSDRGLEHRVAQDGAAAGERIVAEIEGTATPQTFDPLMAVNNMIFEAALKAGGLYLMTGDHCPLCELAKHKGDRFPPEWINGAADSVAEYCRKHNLQG